jgi:hypothetical protein
MQSHCIVTGAVNEVNLFTSDVTRPAGLAVGAAVLEAAAIFGS